MLDQDTREQLKSLFSPLENPVALVYSPSFHEDQKDLVEMLEEVASTSVKLEARLESPPDGRQSPYPQFFISYKEKPTGIVFHGIPGGHEFSSLVLAILNADGKGKFPDLFLIERIRNIRGPIEIKTYISLSCEICPDVVQMLNQMALIHPQFRHEIIDGQYTPSELEKLDIKGVPSLIVGDQLLHSGRITRLDLVKKLEDFFGVSDKVESLKKLEKNLGTFDIAVIGGGPAGASAAIYSARKGLKTCLIAEKFGGQVQETKGIENLISVPYTEGPQLATQLLKHVQAYPIKIFESRRVQEIDLNFDKKKKTIRLESGEFVLTESIIISTGAKWRELNIPGEKEYLGRGVAFCPHCDGPFYKDKIVAVIGGGNSGVEAAIDLAGIVKKLILIEYMDTLKADQILVDKLMSLKNVTILTSAQVQKVTGNGKKVEGIDYLDRQSQQIKKLDLEGVFIQIGLIPNSQFLRSTIELNKFGEIVVDQKGRTSVPGIYAAGDVTTTPFKQIIIAMGEGAKAALTAFEDHAFS